MFISATLADVNWICAIASASLLLFFTVKRSVAPVKLYTLSSSSVIISRYVLLSPRGNDKFCIWMRSPPNNSCSSIASPASVVLCVELDDDELELCELLELDTLLLDIDDELELLLLLDELLGDCDDELELDELQLLELDDSLLDDEHELLELLLLELGLWLDDDDEELDDDELDELLLDDDDDGD